MSCICPTSLHVFLAALLDSVISFPVRWIYCKRTYRDAGGGNDCTCSDTLRQLEHMRTDLQCVVGIVVLQRASMQLFVHDLLDSGFLKPKGVELRLSSAHIKRLSMLSQNEDYVKATLRQIVSVECLIALSRNKAIMLVSFRKRAESGLGTSRFTDHSLNIPEHNQQHPLYPKLSCLH